MYGKFSSSSRRLAGPYPAPWRGRPPISRTFKTKADAEAWVHQIESAISRGVYRDCSQAERYTLGEGLTRYGKEISPLKKSADAEASRIAFLLRHFANRAKLLAGAFTLFTDELERTGPKAAPGAARLSALGKAYMRFALRHPALFRLMFNPEAMEPSGVTHPGLQKRPATAPTPS